MQMTFRWYGKDLDKITLSQIRQIPGMRGIVTSLYDIPVGDIWPLDRIMELKEEIESHGLTFETIESVNVHEDIKLGLPSRDKYIENYKETLRNLKEAGIKVVCYNFMPIFDWTRSDLAKELEDGSTTLSYDENVVEKIDPEEFVKSIEDDSDGFTMPGWEPERLAELKDLFKKYENVTQEDLWDNLEYFLKEIIPVAKECDIKMAIHPDDPPWPIFGLPRIITSRESVERLCKLVDNKYNGLTLCSGSFGSGGKNDVPSIIREFGDRIHFGHVRNVKNHGENSFIETSHLSEDGSIDIYEVMKAYHDIGFTGPIRPDHGRMIWGETGRPGYGLYDRALGATYINGLWEAIDKESKRRDR